MCTIIVGDSENKTSYKLPHHRADGYATVWRGVAACAAVLMGARGGVDAPTSDIAGAKTHIAKHYKDFDKGEPPWEKGVSQAQIIDEIDYLITLLDKEGISDEVKKSLQSLAKFIKRSPVNDITVNIEREITYEDIQEAIKRIANKQEEK